MQGPLIHIVEAEGHELWSSIEFYRVCHIVAVLFGNQE